MKNNELFIELTKQWTNVQTARIIGCNERSVYRYRSGDKPVSTTVFHIVRLARAVDREEHVTAELMVDEWRNDR